MAPPRFIRTPDHHFEGLPDFPFAPHYLAWNGLRLHYLDEGPRDGPVALMLHGEPTWCYLYRKMIPPLVAAGYRCIAPDYIGFGRSDKVIDDAWHVIERHCESIRFLIEQLDLQRISLFVQDWGGPIGLLQAVDMPARFARLAILNTWLHSDAYVYSPMTQYWREAATHPLWLAWTKGAFPAGAMMAMGVGRPLDIAALSQSAAVSGFDADVSDIERAYEAPFPPGGASRAGPRRLPWLLPFAEPEAGAADEQARCFEALKSWRKPAHFIFGANDGAFTPAWGRSWAATIPGATFDEVDAGHFVQEDAAEDAVSIFLARAAEHPEAPQ